MSKLIKVKNYKGFVIARMEGRNDAFFVFSPGEWQYRHCSFNPEFECGSVVECVENIDSY